MDKVRPWCGQSSLVLYLYSNATHLSVIKTVAYYKANPRIKDGYMNRTDELANSFIDSLCTILAQVYSGGIYVLLYLMYLLRTQ